MLDLQAHRGGMALAPENTLVAFGNALTLGVSTLELDVQISRDGHPMVSHERVMPDGEFISWLSRSEMSLCTLDEVFALMAERGAVDVRLNVETKFDVVHPDELAPRERFVDAVLESVRRANAVDRVSIQSFDWGVLELIGSAEAGLARNVLTNTAYLEVGKPGASPWMAGVDVDDFGGDVIKASSGRGYTALSPQEALVTADWVAEAHASDLRVIPYTVDDPARMLALIDAGVDGFITNRPDVGRRVMADRGLALPTAYPPSG